LRRAPILALIFSGCTCSEEPAVTSAPPAAVEAAATPTAVPPTAPAPTATAAAAPQDAPAAPPAIAADSPPSRSACDRYIAALSGRTQDAALLESADLKAVLQVAPDLGTCTAVASDSDALCQKLFPVESGPTMMCRHTRAIFHELKNYPQGRSFMFTEIDWQGCRGIPVMPATVCDAMRDALRAGDVEACAKAGDAASICRAYATLDKSVCRLEGELAKATFSMPDKKEGETGKVELKPAAEKSCRQLIESRAFMAKGLKALAESGPAREKALAKAALGEPDACATFAEPALELCAGRTSAAPPAQVPPLPSEGSGGEEKTQGGGAPSQDAPKLDAPKADAPAQIS
jgi:hypothetical protein